MIHASISATGAAVAAFAITADRKALGAALSLAKRVTERRNSIPILSHVVLKVDRPDVLEIVATDLDMMLRHEVPADAPQTGAFCLDLSTLESTIKKMKGATVRLQDMGAGRVSVSDVETGATVRVPTKPVADFPFMAEPEDAVRVPFGAAQLRDGLDTVRPGISTEETRYYLNGVYIHATLSGPRSRTEEHEALSAEIADARAAQRAHERAQAEGTEAQLSPEDAQALADRLAALREREAELDAALSAPDCIRFAATDGHRLFRLTLPLPAEAEGMPGVILPRKAAGVIGHAIGKKPASDVATLSLSRSRFTFAHGRTRITGKLIDGTFPDYTRVIPSYNAGRLTVDADSFVQDVEAVAAVCSDKVRAITLSLASERFVTLYASSPECGAAARVLDGADYHAGGNEKIAETVLGCNARYLIQACSAFAGGTLTIETEDGAAPFLIRSDARPDLIVVQMPMRVGGELITPGAIERMNMNPVETLDSEGPRHVEAIEAIAAQEGPAKPKLRALAVARYALGKLATDARAFLVTSGNAPAVARHIVKAKLAALYGDQAARGRAQEIVAHLMAPDGKRGTFAALSAVQPRPEPARPQPAPERLPEPVKPKPQPVELPKPQPVAEAEEPAAEAPAAEPIQPVEAVEAEAEPVKIEDVYGRVFYVLAADLDDEAKPFVRRLHKNGAPFTDRESRGGSWQRICRENIRRRILPRGSVDAPSRPSRTQDPAPAGSVDVEALSLAVAALQAQMAALVAAQGGAQPVEAPAVQEADTSAQDEIAELRAQLAAERAENERLTGLLAAADDDRRAAWAAEAKSDARYREERRRRVALAGLAQRSRARLRERLYARFAERQEARNERDAAVERASRLQARCDALESHAAASARLDRRSDEQVLNGHAIILPDVPSRPRAQA